MAQDADIEVALVNRQIQCVPVVVGFAFKSGSAYPVKNGVIVLTQDEVAAKKIWLTYKIKSSKELKKIN